MRKIISTCIFLVHFSGIAQLKFLIDDFEGFDNGTSDLTRCGYFTYGNLKQRIVSDRCTNQDFSGQHALMIQSSRGDFGGWGRGVGLMMELDQRTDYLCFYVYSPSSNAPVGFNVELQEDDDADGTFKNERDDSWNCNLRIEPKDEWQLITLPLTKFNDRNPGGDGGFNINYHQGKCCVVLFNLEDAKKISAGQTWLFDFICFSKGPLPQGQRVLDAPRAQSGDFAELGAWSAEGNSANFVDIAHSFEKHFNNEKKLGVVHFFQSFSVEKDGAEYHYPSIDRINKVIQAGYTPMITLEDHFVNTGSKTRQPNLYSIVEGHFDSFFGYWAHQIKEVKGTVLLRILHEFNGDWYPWCTAKNDRNPYLVAKAYRYIVNIFRQNNVTNVKFIWCPNSMSVPQEKWNFIMDAYPGDEYVDFVAMDVYNGAGQGEGVDIWRSFRKEAAENYFLFTERLPTKPILICETASRERRGGEKGQDKGMWIREMSRCVKSDMSKIRLISWFNEKETFEVTSSSYARQAFLEALIGDAYFKNGQLELK